MIRSGASGTGTGLKLLLIGLGRGYGLNHQKEKRSMNHFACRRRGGASGDLGGGRGRSATALTPSPYRELRSRSWHVS